MCGGFDSPTGTHLGYTAVPVRDMCHNIFDRDKILGFVCVCTHTIRTLLLVWSLANRRTISESPLRASTPFKNTNNATATRTNLPTHPLTAQNTKAAACLGRCVPEHLQAICSSHSTWTPPPDNCPI